eukprot:15060217-Alexandrium_andersonii.AAC.1
MLGNEFRTQVTTTILVETVVVMRVLHVLLRGIGKGRVGLALANAFIVAWLNGGAQEEVAAALLL